MKHYWKTEPGRQVYLYHFVVRVMIYGINAHISEFRKFISLVRHDQQNLGRFNLGRFC